MIRELEKKLNYIFKNSRLLNVALTHSSYSNERHLRDNYERLEFLGDAVLELVISDFLFKKFPKLGEGDLTRMRAGIVCEPNLAVVARNLGLGGSIFLGRGEELTGGEDRDSILADVLEAVFGAIYLDSGLEAATKTIVDVLEVDSYSEKRAKAFVDYKTKLQEIVQKDGKSQLVYDIIDESGPDHNKFFTAQVTSCGVTLGQGAGKSKKEAEQNAAADALKRI